MAVRAVRSGYFLLFVREFAVAIDRARQVTAHRLARRLRLARADRLVNPPVLLLDQGEIGAAAAHALGEPGHRAPRDQVATDELQEAGELGIPRGFGDRAMECEVLVHRGLSLRRGAL